MKKEKAEKVQPAKDILTVAIEDFTALKLRKKDLEAEISTINEGLAVLEERIIMLMDDRDLKRVTTDEYTYSPSARIFFGFGDNEGDRDKGMAWIKKNHPELLAVNSQSLTGFFSAQMRQVKNFKLPSFFKQSSRAYVGMRSAKEKTGSENQTQRGENHG